MPAPCPSMPERFHFDAEGERLTALHYQATKPLGFTLLLGPGASAGQHADFVVDYATGLARRGVLVVTYDFPFTEHGRRSPDRSEVLDLCCRAAIVAARECRPKNRLFIGGKSLGGRVACDVAATGGAEVDELAGLVLLGFPLHAIGRPETPRWGLMRELRVPALIVQGMRDVFGTPEELRPVLATLAKGSKIHAVEGGDHSFSVPARAKQTQGQTHAAIQDEIARWMSAVALAPSASPAPAKRRPIASRLGAQLKALHRGASS